MKKIFVSCICLLLMTSCGKKEDTEGSMTGAVVKQDFFVEVKEFDSFPKSYDIKKTGKLSSSQSVKLNSNASGRITQVYVKEGQKVNSGQILASLADNIGSYNINVDKASNDVARTKINYDAQKINLDKQVADAELSLTKLNQNLENLKKTNSQNIKTSENNLQSLNVDENIAKIDLSIEKLDNNVAKLELDFTNQKDAHQETIAGYKSRVMIDHSSLRISMDDIIDFSDKILGITPQNEDENDDFQTYLGAKDKIQKTVSERLLRDVITFRTGSFEDIIPEDTSSITEEQVQDILDNSDRGYNLMNSLLFELEKTFHNSIVSVGRLSQPQIDAYITQINGYQGAIQSSYAGFVSSKSQIESFLRTYENLENATQKQIDLFAKDRDILLKDREILLINLENNEDNITIGLENTVIQGEDAIINLKNQIAVTKSALDNAKKNREVTLRSLNNAIQGANINYSQAVRERGKLSIYAPISGTIAAINIDLGQEVSNGATLFNIENTSNTEVVISLSSNELDIVKSGTKVVVLVGTKKLQGKIFSISSIADENLNFKTTILLDKPIERLGELVEVFIPVSLENILIPLNIITVDNSGEVGSVHVLNPDMTFSELGVTLGRTYGDSIEIGKCENNAVSEDEEEKELFIACEVFNKSQVIISNLNNFDANKFNVIIK